MKFFVFVWILFLDVCKTLPYMICSLIVSAGPKEAEWCLFIMSICSWNYKIQAPISNYFTNSADFFLFINYINNLAVKRNPVINWEHPGGRGKTSSEVFIHSFFLHLYSLQAYCSTKVKTTPTMYHWTFHSLHVSLWSFTTEVLCV